jgi:hypothetical protein
MSNSVANALDRAGTALLHAARLQAQIANKPGVPLLNCAGYKALLAQARHLLSAVSPAVDPYKFLAAKTALEVLEAIERGDATLNGVALFKNFAEGVHGGEREIDLGGRSRTGQKPSTNQAFLRAAAVVLWERFPKERDWLVSQARSVIGVGAKAKLQKMVENFHARHDFDIAISGSPLSIHMGVVNDLIEHHEYRSLKDFV